MSQWCWAGSPREKGPAKNILQLKLMVRTRLCPLPAEHPPRRAPRGGYYRRQGSRLYRETDAQTHRHTQSSPRQPPAPPRA